MLYCEQSKGCTWMLVLYCEQSKGCTWTPEHGVYLEAGVILGIYFSYFLDRLDFGAVPNLAVWGIID